MPLTREIAQAKLAAGMSQAQIARQHRVTRQYVSNLLSRPTGGKRGRPRKGAGTIACVACEGTGRVRADTALRDDIAGVND